MRCEMLCGERINYRYSFFPLGICYDYTMQIGGESTAAEISAQAGEKEIFII